MILLYNGIHQPEPAETKNSNSPPIVKDQYIGRLRVKQKTRSYAHTYMLCYMPHVQTTSHHACITCSTSTSHISIQLKDKCYIHTYTHLHLCIRMHHFTSVVHLSTAMRNKLILYHSTRCITCMLHVCTHHAASASWPRSSASWLKSQGFF